MTTIVKQGIEVLSRVVPLLGATDMGIEATLSRLIDDPSGDNIEDVLMHKNYVGPVRITNALNEFMKPQIKHHQDVYKSYSSAVASCERHMPEGTPINENVKRRWEDNKRVAERFETYRHFYNTLHRRLNNKKGGLKAFTNAYDKMSKEAHLWGKDADHYDSLGKPLPLIEDY